MKCSEFLHELTDYLDGVMDSPTKAELEEHLAWCHNCYVVCDTTKKTIEIYRDSQLYELPVRHCSEVPVTQEGWAGVKTVVGCWSLAFFSILCDVVNAGECRLFSLR